ncbi:sigma-70 family RNA polymerase sigma factor [Luteolibacter algae]|uniref:Sigma-70 family RNA polymerase sigma factor n=1 Tax=Luteolibacter algae TaxID=454151 RepID=A0ABW5D5T1_9BACT
MMLVANEDPSVPHFEHEVGAVQPRLTRYLIASVGNSADVDDILQETNLVLWKKRLDFEPGTSFWAWAQKVAFFQIMAFRKRQSRSRLVLDDDVVHLLAAEAPVVLEQENPANHLQLKTCIETLPDRQREFIHGHYYEKRSLKSLADLHSTSVAAVGQTLYRARLNLQRCLLKSSNRFSQ